MQIIMNKLVPYLIGALVGLFLALIVAVIGYFIIREKYDLIEVKDNEIQQQDLEEKADNLQLNYEGAYLTGSLPDSWNIIEHTDGAGTQMLVQGPVYTGLTGVEIKNADLVTIFKLSAVHGIGGSGQCFKYVRFNDFKQSDYDAINAENISIFNEPVELVDLSDEEYTEFNLLNLRVRRIDNELYWDRVSGNNFFESATCSMQSAFPAIEGLNYYVDGDLTKLYQWKIEGSPSLEDLTILDSILDSLKVI